MHPSVYLRKCELVVNCQWLKFNAVNSQSPENQRGQWSNAQKELVKVLTSMAIESMGVTPPQCWVTNAKYFCVGICPIPQLPTSNIRPPPTSTPKFLHR